MNIALLSNSMINRTLAFNASYVLGREIENIFLPVENHSPDELFFSEREQLHICDDINEIIQQSDIIVSTNPDCLRLLDKSKKTVLVNNPWETKNEEKSSEGFFCTSRKPTIAILSLGRFTDQYYTEILVNKILSEFGAKAHQVYSKETLSILTDLYEQNLLNRCLLDIKETEADVFIVSMDGTKFHNDAEFVCELSRISPDLLFVCIDRFFSNIDGIDNIAGIVCRVSSAIRSPYVMYDVGTGVKYPVYCGLGDEISSVNSLNPSLEAHLRTIILKALYFPKGTIVL